MLNFLGAVLVPIAVLCFSTDNQAQSGDVERLKPNRDVDTRVARSLTWA